MADILGFEIPIDAPTFGIGGSPIWWFIFFILLVGVIGVVGIYFLYRFKVYRYKIIVFENVAGQGYTPTIRDRAKVVKIGDGGEEILQLLKRKVFRSAYGRKMGANTYWYAIGQDGYWYNFVLGDIDAKLGMLDIEPIDRDMRYMHVAIRKNIIDRYKKTSWLEQHAVQMFSAIVILIMLLGVWFVLDKVAEVASTTANNINTVDKTASKLESVAVALNNVADRITGGGSGIVPAG